MNLIEFLLTTIYLILAVSLLIFVKWLFLPFPSAIKTIILFNANSVSTPGKKEKIADQLTKNPKIDVIAITETQLPMGKAGDDKFKASCPKGFSGLQEPRKQVPEQDQGPRGGVGIMFRDFIKGVKIDLKFSPTSFEYLVVQLKDYAFFVIVYPTQKPNEACKQLLSSNMSSREVFRKEFKEFLNMLRRDKRIKFTNLIIMCAFNIRMNELTIRRKVKTNEVEEFEELLNEFGLEQKVKDPTRDAYILDLVIANKELALKCDTKEKFYGRKIVETVIKC